MEESIKNNGMLYDLILEQIYGLNDNYKKLSEDIQETNIAINSLNNMREDFSNVKKTQEFMNRTMTIEDAKRIKEFYVNFNKIGESLEKIEKDIESLTKTMDDYNKFKAQIKAVMYIITIMVTAGIIKEIITFFSH